MFTETPKRGIDLFLSLLMLIDQEIQQVNGLDHAIVCGCETLGGRNDVVPARLTSNPELNTLIFSLTVGIVCDFVDNNALRGVIRVEHW